MKPITNNVSILLMSFSLCLSFLSFVKAAVGNKLIAETCQKAKFKDLCISSLEAEHASQDATDLAALAMIAIKVATNNGSDTSVFIKKTLDNAKLEPAVEQNFEDCSENFISAMEQLEDSVGSLQSKVYDDVQTWLEAAITDATACETGLMKQKQGDELELSNRATNFLQLCSNALDIVNLLDTN